MNELLYIDGQLVDLGEEVNITLNYKSNMLTELNKIVGNNSYTIKLPKTNRNLSIIGCADVAGVVSSFPRTYHSARYFRNGVEIISRGNAMLLSVSDSIEIVLTWGNTMGFNALVDEDKNLTDFINSTVWIAWTDVVTPGAYGVANVMYSDMDFGLNDNETIVKMHPSVRVSYVLSLIGQKYGVTFEFEDREDYLSKLIIPLLTRNGGYANRQSNTGTIYRKAPGEYYLSKSAMFDDYFESNESGFVFRAKASGKLVVTPSFSSMLMEGSLRYGTDSISENTIYFPYEVDSVLNSYIYRTPIEVDLSEGDYFAVNTGMFPFSVGDNNEVYEVGMQPDEILLGDRFPIVENLPDVKVIDFIKAIASMLGVFAVPSSDGSVLKFVPFDSLADHSKALDWSDKLIPRDNTNRPRSISYSLDDFAQNNRMLYKQDDSVAVYANGNIVVGDTTLDYERDAVELPFAPTDMKEQKAKIRLYEYNDDGEPELQSVEPRILIEKDVNGLSTGVFGGLDWRTLINNYYGTYQNVVKSPVVLTESVRLDELSLRDLDVSVPVYLRQYGKYYAIVELKAPSSGVCECKLLQLD